jgi:phage shock protein C
MQQSRLYRDTKNQVIGGVCAGLGNYLNTDPLLFRIIFVLLALFGGGGLIIYVLLWIFLTEDPSNTIYEAKSNENEPDEAGQQSPNRSDQSKGSMIAGLILIGVGAIFLVDRFVPHIYFDDLWPLLLIIAGVVIISNYFKTEKNKNNEL